jgi:hypothetical protein
MSNMTWGPSLNAPEHRFMRVQCTVQAKAKPSLRTLHTHASQTAAYNYIKHVMVAEKGSWKPLSTSRRQQLEKDKLLFCLHFVFKIRRNHNIPFFNL